MKRQTSEDRDREKLLLSVLWPSIVMRLRSCPGPIEVFLTHKEHSRVWDGLQLGKGGFFYFEGTDERRYAVNSRHLMSWALKREPHGKPMDVPYDETIHVHFTDGTTEIRHCPEDDQLDEIFCQLSMDSPDLLYFTDENDEQCWYRADNIVLFAAPTRRPEE